MTGQKLYENALAVLAVPPLDAGDYSRSAVTDINIVTAELFEANNTVRMARGRQPLAEPPVIAHLEDEVGLEPYVIFKAGLYGVASRMVADDDLQRAVYYHNLYVAGIADCCRAVAGGVIDVYRSGF